MLIKEISGKLGPQTTPRRVPKLDFPWSSQCLPPIATERAIRQRRIEHAGPASKTASIDCARRTNMPSPPTPATPLSRDQLSRGMPTTALAFRGYNSTNLGKTPQLLANPRYREVLSKHLERAQQICSEVADRRVNLLQLVEQQLEPTPDQYPEALALIVSVSQAQLELLQHHTEIEPHLANVAFGFSLGEISALIFSGVLTEESALQVVLRLAVDCQPLAEGVTLGVIFSRGAAIELDRLWLLCQRINQKGTGTVGISAQLSPNSYLVMGTENTLDELRDSASEQWGRRIQIKKDPNRWPPLHTPLVWKGQVRDRACELMQTMPGGFNPPSPPILSLVTGKNSYDGIRTRRLLAEWIDQPQCLWQAVAQTLEIGIETILHIGPAPNIIPATYGRLSANIQAQTSQSRRLRALAVAAQRQWLQRLLPRQTALLRAPLLKHVVLEDWLLEQSRS